MIYSSCNSTNLTSYSSAIFGLCTKCPLLLEGVSPVQANFKHSIIVVFPQPLCPENISR